MVRMCIRRARATKSGRPSFSLPFRAGQHKRSGAKQSELKRWQRSQHQAEEAHKKVGVKKRTYTSKFSSICNMNDAQPSDSRSGMG